MGDPCTDCTWDELGVNVSFCPTHDAAAREALSGCIRTWREKKAVRDAEDDAAYARERSARNGSAARDE